MIIDWDDAYANGIYVDGVDEIVAVWKRDSASYRANMQTAGRAELKVLSQSFASLNWPAFSPNLRH